MTGVHGGYDMDPRRLAADGVTLVGRITGAQDGVLSIADDLRVSVTHGDESLPAFNERCDAAARAQGLDMPPPDGPAPPLPDAPALREPIRRLDLARENITSVVWCNGARPDFAWVDLPVFGEGPGPKRMPMHQRGATAQAGLYFLGLPWLHKWKSAFLFGADEDAGHIAALIDGAAT